MPPSISQGTCSPQLTVARRGCHCCWEDRTPSTVSLARAQRKCFFIGRTSRNVLSWGKLDSAAVSRSAAMPKGFEPLSISCPTSSSCSIVGSMSGRASILTTVDDGAGWQLRTLLTTIKDIYDISCASPRRCAALIDSRVHSGLLSAHRECGNNHGTSNELPADRSVFSALSNVRTPPPASPLAVHRPTRPSLREPETPLVGASTCSWQGG